jgi:hypothetical protein
MAGKQLYHAQLEALKELEAHLKRIDNELQMLMRGYAAKVSELPSKGLPVEVHDKIMAEFYRSSQNLVTQGCAVIKEQAIPYVRRQIGLTEQLLVRQAGKCLGFCIALIK